MKKQSFILRAGLLRACWLVALVLGSQRVSAQTVIDWNGSAGTSGTTPWATSANWNGGAVPAGDLTTNTARFDLTSYTNKLPDIGVSTLISGIQIGDGTTATGTMTLSGTGTTLGIGGGGITMFANAGAATVSVSTINLGASQSWTNNSTGHALMVSSNVTNIGNTSPFALTVTGAGTTTLTGILSDGGATGTTALVKSGAGTLTVTGANTFTGGTTLTGGTLIVKTSATALGAVGAAVSLSGGTLDMQNGSAWNTTVNGNATILTDSASATAGQTRNLGTLSIGGNTLTIGAGTIFTSGTALVNFQGATTLNSATSATTILNPTTVGAATLASGLALTSVMGSATAGNVDTLQLDGTSVNNTITGIVGDGGGGGKVALTKANSSTWTLSGANTYTGGTTVSGGTLIANNATALGAAGSAVSLSGGTLDIQLGSAWNTTISGNATILSDRATTGVGADRTLGTLSIGGNTVTVGAGANVTSGTARVLFGNTTLTSTTSATTVLNPTTAPLVINGTVTGSAASGQVNTLDLDGTLVGTGASGTINKITGVISDGSGGGKVAVTKSNVGIWYLQGASSYTGGTIISGGTLVAQLSSSALGATTGGVSIGGGGILDLQVNAGINAYPVTVTGVATIISDASTASTAGFTHTLGTLSIGGNTLNITAGTNISGGTPMIGFGATTLNSATTATTLFNPTSAGLTLASVKGSATAGNTDTLQLDGTNAGSAITGAISDGSGGGNVALTKSNVGTWTLSGANTYTGNTLISAGTLMLASGGQLTFVLSGGTFNEISGAGTLVLSGGFKFDLTGASSGTYTIIDGSILSNTTFNGSFGVSDASTAWTNASGVWTDVRGDSFNVATGLLSVVAVPEPETWMLLCVGLGLGVWNFRRRVVPVA